MIAMKSNRILVFVLGVLALASCSTYKDILYFQNIDNVRLAKLPDNYEAVIKKDDKISIVVSGPDKTVTAPYNLTLGEMNPNGYSNGNPEQATLSYLVDPDGNIDFPILGKIHVEGMTRNQLVNYLTQEIGKDVKEPIVYVSFRNYKFTVDGEVKSAGVYTWDSEKINVLQALSRAGGLTIYAQRDDLLLLREENGVINHYYFSLRDARLLESPCFYLQQNDYIYVPTSPTRIATATTATGIWSIILSSITTTIALLGFLL